MEIVKQKISYDAVNQMVKSIAKEYADKGITKIVGISRGGLPAAVMLSHLLEVPLDTLHWQTRDGKLKDVEKLMSFKDEINTILFIDDIFDSGTTFYSLKEHMPELRLVTLVSKEKYGPEDYVLDIDENIWIDFPWELKPISQFEGLTIEEFSNEELLENRIAYKPSEDNDQIVLLSIRDCKEINENGEHETIRKGTLVEGTWRYNDKYFKAVKLLINCIEVAESAREGYIAIFNNSLLMRKNELN